MSNEGRYLDSSRAIESKLTTFLQDIVRIPSLSEHEGAVIERIGEEMRALGFEEVRTDAMGNLIGRIGSGPTVIALDGHIDTVDTGDRAAWRRDPHSGDVVDGVLYGRGAADQKGGLACAVYAGGLLAQRGIPDSVTLYVTATVQEED